MSTKNQQTTRVINSIISPWNGINRKENWITEIQMQLIHYVKIGEIHTTLRTKGSRIGSSKCPSACNFITSRTTLHSSESKSNVKKTLHSSVNQLHNITTFSVCVCVLPFPFTTGMTPIFLKQFIAAHKFIRTPLSTMVYISAKTINTRFNFVLHLNKHVIHACMFAPTIKFMANKSHSVAIEETPIGWISESDTHLEKGGGFLRLSSGVFPSSGRRLSDMAEEGTKRRRKKESSNSTTLRCCWK